MEAIVRTKLEAALRPLRLELVNESGKHNVPKGSESHFKILVVSELFEGKSLLERHRMVNSALGEELKKGTTCGGEGGGIHALSITAKTPAQFASDSSAGTTPACLGGDKKVSSEA